MTRPLRLKDYRVCAGCGTPTRRQDGKGGRNVDVCRYCPMPEKDGVRTVPGRNAGSAKILVRYWGYKGKRK